MSCSITLHPDNSLKFAVTLTNGGVAVNDATVTATVYDTDDVEVTGETWPLTLAYVTDSDGEYEETTNPISGIVAGTLYKIVISAVGTDNLEGQWTHWATATTRGCD